MDRRAIQHLAISRHESRDTWIFSDLGKEPGDTFANDQFPDTKFDYILANPPFNISDWGGDQYESDVRWKFGRPPVGNANLRGFNTCSGSLLRRSGRRCPC